MLGPGPEDGDIIEMSPRESRLPRFTRLPRRPRLRRGQGGGRGRLVILVPAVCLLLVAGAAFAATRISPPAPANPALAKLVAEVTSVPVSAGAPGNLTYDTWVSSAGDSSSASALITSLSFDSTPTSVSGPPLSAAGKPEVLYVASEYCPYCAAENWALIVALSRFGSFSGLGTSRSPHFEGIPPIDGWTFHGSTYTSRYLAFAGVETYSNKLVSRTAAPNDPKSYRPLQRLTPAQEAVLDRFDNGRQTPFFDFGGRVTLIGSDVVPDYLAGLSWTRIAAGLRRPATPAAATILTAANLLTSQFCKLTGDRPAAACPKWTR